MMLTEHVHRYYIYPRFATERNEIGMSYVYCRQVTAGKGDTECQWTRSSQRNESFVYIWDASGELLMQMTSSELSLVFEMSVEMFDKQLTVQVKDSTTSLILYGELIFITLSYLCKPCIHSS